MVIKNNIMKKQQLERQLETVIGRLTRLNYIIQGEPLKDVIAQTSEILKLVNEGELKPKKEPPERR